MRVGSTSFAPMFALHGRIRRRLWIKTRRATEALATYGVNHVMMRVPVYRFRTAAVRMLLGWSCGRGVALHMGCFCTGRNVEIGAHTVINRRCYLDGRGTLRIGSNCSISPEVYILTATHDPQSPAFRPVARETFIGDDVWIGARALLLPGVHIGERAIVGAGAVVTRDVNPGEIVAGNPARVIGHRRCGIEYTLKYFPLFDTDVVF